MTIEQIRETLAAVPVGGRVRVTPVDGEVWHGDWGGAVGKPAPVIEFTLAEDGWVAHIPETGKSGPPMEQEQVAWRCTSTLLWRTPPTIEVLP